MNDNTDNVIPFTGKARAAWQFTCDKNEKGKLIPNLHNALIALNFDHDIRDVYAFDLMERCIIKQHEIGRIDTVMKPLTDNDVVELQGWMQHPEKGGLRGMGLETVRNAILHHAHQNEYHPVKDYLRSLQWDGVPRLEVWLSRYLGGELNAYTRTIGKLFLVAMIARIAQPGCQADYMIVLEGPQGIMKSSACRILGGVWFSDHLPEISGPGAKEASMHLRGRWLIEVAEMHAMSRAEATQLKSFITRTKELYRPAYGRNEVHEPRQCVFIGTTNQDEYLKDPTGGRRFWPVKTGVSGRIDLDALAEDRDMLFAEALAAYKQGDPWWPDGSFERELIMPEQAARLVGDIWEDRIKQWIVGKERTTTSELAAEALAIPVGQMKHEHSLRIAHVLRELGWNLRRSGANRYWRR